MSFISAKKSLAHDLEKIKEEGLWKTERIIASEQKNDITLADGSEVINMCANNYLGLANNPDVIAAAKESYDKRTKKTLYSFHDMAWNFAGSAIGSLAGSNCH